MRLPATVAPQAARQRSCCIECGLMISHLHKHLDQNGSYAPGCVPVNVANSFRDSMERYATEKWTESKGVGDIIAVDGNAFGASYLVISKDPWQNGTESFVETAPLFTPSLEAYLGVHLTQRTLGQEFSVEVVDDAMLPEVADIMISSISQAGTLLTIQTLADHGLRPGMRVGVAGVQDSRLCYAALVVSGASGKTLTATAGPAGSIPSLTVGPFSGGSVYFRSSIGRARNGASMVFESASATQACFYSRADAGDALPSGSAVASHAVTCASTASVLPAVVAGAYVAQPTSEYRVRLTPEEVNWLDAGIDSVSVITSRLRRTQVVPSADAVYKVRLRAVNHQSMTRPVANIVSVSKSGGTTATVVCDRPHQLSTSSYVVTAGVRDTANFPGITAQTVVTAIVDSVTFQVSWGSAATAASVGGVVILCCGGQAAQGVPNISVQTAQVDQGVLALVGSAAWSGFSIGEYVNLAGLIGAGGTLGLDGAWRVRDVVGTAAYFESLAAAPADMALTTCGGAIMRRTDFRISWVRVADYERQRVEWAQRGASDAYQALVAYITGGTVVLSTGVSSIGYVGTRLPFTPATTDVTSAALTGSATTSAITPEGGSSFVATVAVTAVSGTSPTLDVGVEISDDGGANWVRVYDFPRINATGMYRSPALQMLGNRVRYVQTVGGTSPSFTRQINRLQGNDQPPPLRQLIDRSVVMNTLNSATPALDVRNCRNLQLIAHVTAATTNASLQLEGSDDASASWYSIGAPLACAPGAPVTVTINNVQASQVRARVSVAGTGVAYNYVLLKGF